jgi:predicted nucleic acid-binding protein
MKLVDTSVAIDHLRGHEAAVRLLHDVVAADEMLAASEVVRFELLAGVRPDELASLEEFFSALAWIPVDEAVTRAGGALAHRHRAAHGGIDDVDYLIAATALLFDADLLTTNIRHFPMLPGIEAPY